MRAFEFLTEAKKVGREFNHLEDLVFTEDGGVFKAINVLKNLASGAKDVAVKWDGNPTVYWGRDDKGQFRMFPKNAWEYIKRGKSEVSPGVPTVLSNPKDVDTFIMNTGKIEPGKEQERQNFADGMSGLWPILEKATPENFKGFVFGDLLYYSEKPFTADTNVIKFTPNKVTYTVKKESEIGKRIAASKVGVAVHAVYDGLGSTVGQPIKNVDSLSGNSDLVVVGQTYVTHKPAVGAENLSAIENEANKSSKQISNLLTPVKGLSGLAEIVYKFVNTKSKAKQLDQLDPKNFFDWLATSTVSAGQQQRIQDLSQQYEGAMASMFFLVREIMKAKDEIIKELDQAEGDITASTGDVPGGEGYVKTGDKVKLVPRDRWTPN